jgi:hypothetical protein
MWDPRHLTTLQASTACYGDNFTFIALYLLCVICRQDLALTSPTSGGRSAGKVRSWTQATEFNFILCPLLFASCFVSCCSATATGQNAFAVQLSNSNDSDDDYDNNNNGYIFGLRERLWVLKAGFSQPMWRDWSSYWKI